VVVVVVAAAAVVVAAAVAVVAAVAAAVAAANVTDEEWHASRIQSGTLPCALNDAAVAKSSSATPANLDLVESTKSSICQNRLFIVKGQNGLSVAWKLDIVQKVSFLRFMRIYFIAIKVSSRFLCNS